MNPNLKSRRTTLKLTALSGGLLSLTELAKPWTKPVVESILLPGHAQMTTETPDVPENPEQPLGPIISCTGSTTDGPVSEGDGVVTDVTLTSEIQI